jgi:hypothetical protein
MEVTMDVYEVNRSRFSVEELREYRGKWVAFSPDGSRIVASSDEIGDLDKLVAAIGADPELVGIERITFAEEDEFLGGIELE